MSLPLTLVFVGLIILFVGFAFAAVNMFRGVTRKDPFAGFGALLKEHIAAMIVMAFGGLLFVIGLVLIIVDFLDRLA